MRINIPKPVLIVLCIGLLSACGGGSSSDSSSSDSSSSGNGTTDPINTPDTNTDASVDPNVGANPGTSTNVGENSGDNPLDVPRALGSGEWSIDGFTFTGNAVASVQSGRSGFIVTVAMDSDTDFTNGAYSGSTISFTSSALGADTYSLVSSASSLVITSSLSPGSPVSHVALDAGQLPPGLELASTRWESVTGSLAVTVDGDGFYHYSSIEPLTFTRTSITGTGIPGAPEQVTVVINDVVAGIQ